MAKYTYMFDWDERITSCRECPLRPLCDTCDLETLDDDEIPTSYEKRPKECRLKEIDMAHIKAGSKDG